MWNDVSLMHAKTPATVAFSWIKTQQQKTLLTFFYLHFRTCPLSASSACVISQLIALCF